MSQIALANPQTGANGIINITSKKLDDNVGNPGIIEIKSIKVNPSDDEDDSRQADASLNDDDLRQPVIPYRGDDSKQLAVPPNDDDDDDNDNDDDNDDDSRQPVAPPQNNGAPPPQPIVPPVNNPNPGTNKQKKQIDFINVAKFFKIILAIIAGLCIVMYFFVLGLSFFNLLKLIVNLIASIISLFYNKSTSYKETFSYKLKKILSCTKDNYENDILNILNEQTASLSVFNLTVYIIYILLIYIIIYIIYNALTWIPNADDFKFELNGNIFDIDDKNLTLLTIIMFIFGASFIHLLIYKLLFKSLAYAEYKKVDAYETSIDNEITKIIKTGNETFDNTYLLLLHDQSKRGIVNDKIKQEIDNLNSNNVTDNNLYSYLLIYDIYVYLENNTFFNNTRKVEVDKYIIDIMNGNKPDNSFMSFLNANERKLLKPYHEELEYYKQIPTDKLEQYEIINENISKTITFINKNIISYTGTFNAFLFTCIYIIVIFIFNLIAFYLIANLVANSRESNTFYNWFVNIAQKYVLFNNLIFEYLSKLFVGESETK
jgi:hypothetical protein